MLAAAAAAIPLTVAITLGWRSLDIAVTLAAAAGQLQLNVFEPLIAFRLLGAVSELRQACIVLRERCVEGITANPARMRYFVEHSIDIVTALVPRLGYELCSEIAKEALETGKGVFEIVLARRLLSREEINQLLNPARMAGVTPDTAAPNEVAAAAEAVRSPTPRRSG